MNQSPEERTWYQSGMGNYEMRNRMRDKSMNSVGGSPLYIQNREADQQKRALDKLADERYNKIHNDQYHKIHEDAFNKLLNIRKLQKPETWPYRMKCLVKSLWQERKRFKEIMKTQDSEHQKLLKENERIRKQLQTLANEVKKMRGSKGNYGQA